MTATAEGRVFDAVWGKYRLYPCGEGGVLFDPVSLESVYLSGDEVDALAVDDFDLLAELAELGYTDGPRGTGQRDAILARLDEMGMTGVPPRISGFRIVVTDKCNMKCRYCFVDTNTGRPDMTEEDLRAGLDYLFESNAGLDEVTIQWFGGEPTVRFDLMQTGDLYARELAERWRVGRVQSTVVTNGARIKDEMIEHFREYRYGVGVSFDGEPEDNAIERFLLSGKPADPQIHRNIQRMLEAGVHVGCNVTPTAANVHKLPEIVRYVLSLGINFIYVNTPIPISGRWHVDGYALSDSLFRARLVALGRGAMLFSALDRIYQGLDTRVPRVYEHIQADGGLNASLLPGRRISVLDLNWRHAEFVHTIDELRADPSLLGLAAKAPLPSARCLECPAAAVCGGPSRNDVSLRRDPEPDPEMCAFFQHGLELAVTDNTSLQ